MRAMGASVVSPAWQYPAVIRKIVRCLRFAELCEICRGCRRDQFDPADVTRDKIGIPKLAEPDQNVEAFIEEDRCRIHELHLEPDVRMLVQEITDSEAEWISKRRMHSDLYRSARG